MRKFLGILALAGTVAFGAGTASAQDFSVRIGVGDPGYRTVHEVVRERPVIRRRVIERRVERPRRVRTVCRTVIRKHVRRSGVVVRRPVEVCRRVVSRRW